MFRTFGRFVSDMEEYDIRTNIEIAFEGNMRKKRQISDYLVPSIELMEGIQFTFSKKTLFS